MKITTLLFSLYVIFISGCDYLSGCQYLAGAKGYREITSTSEVGNTMKRQKFSSYSPDEQVEIFLYSQRCVDDSRIGAYFVAEGEKEIPSILKRIQTTDNVLGKRELVDALFEINRNCHCITKDSNVIAILEKAEAEIKENKSIPNEYKDIYSDSLKSLKEQVSR